MVTFLIALFLFLQFLNTIIACQNFPGDYQFL
jgi:hypothetical protein